MSNKTFQLAQANLAHLKEPMDSALLKGFVDRLDEINALADASPGFVWRFIIDSRDPQQRVLDDEMVIFNMSVWADIASLHHYVYKSAHNEVFAQRKQWFFDWQARLASSQSVLWWIPAGHIPKPEEAMFRAATLHANGPSADAFSFKRAFNEQGLALF